MNESLAAHVCCCVFNSLFQEKLTDGGYLHAVDSIGATDVVSVCKGLRNLVSYLGWISVHEVVYETGFMEDGWRRMFRHEQKGVALMKDPVHKFRIPDDLYKEHLLECFLPGIRAY